jgi:2,4-dienoyl-CoA reductase-like NADH-dependent reductase (Old Yellow Enzyme family)
MTSTLFTPVSINALEIPNRVVMAPMTRLFSPNGVSTPEMAQYYRRRAAGGVGLIVTEGTVIERPVPVYDLSAPRFWGEDALAAWKLVVDEVHGAGGLIAPQIWHAGAARHPFTNEQLPGLIDSPSGIFEPGNCEDRHEPPMTDEAIADVIAAFGKAAADAKRIGFDALELHGAHGYLIDQFFWDATNRRGSDSYGGDTIQSRVRFGVEVLKSVRTAVGPDFPVILRISQWKGQDYGAKIVRTPGEMEQWLQPLAEAGADSFHCSQRRYWEPEFEGSDLNMAGWA